MQSVPDKANRDQLESQFDFLDLYEDKPLIEPLDSDKRDNAGNSNPGSAPKSGRPPAVDKPFPVIRKPVSVSRSGALRPPRPGDPVEPPPPLTDGMRAEPAPVRREQRAEVDLSELDDLNFDLDDDSWPASDQWRSGARVEPPFRVEKPGTRLWRMCGYILASLLIASGTAAALYSNPSFRIWADEAMVTFTVALENVIDKDRNLLSSDPTAVALEPTEYSDDPTLLAREPAALVGDPDAVAQDPTATAQDGTSAALESIGNASSSANGNAPKSLNTLFREELSRLESLLAQGRLEEAEAIVQSMDPAVYGYGAPEFSDIEERIAARKQEGDVETQAAQLIEQQRIQQEEARALEEQRAAEQRQQLAEAQQQAEAEQEAQEAAARLAEQERQIAEAERLAQQQQAEEERQAAETARLAQEQAQRDREAQASERLRADRVAQEQARQEQLELARQQRIQLEQQQQLVQSPAQEAATAIPQGSIQDIAASQREAAREQRLIDAGNNNAQAPSSESPEQSTNQDTIVALAEPSSPQPTDQVQQTSARRITDADLQLVYGQFAQLEAAIENRDVGAVIRLTERSGARIQQVMQMFENNVSIQARLRNVSTLDSSGEIQGTLQITRLERADGSVTGPPLNLGSVRLSSVREGDGWSSIRW